MLKYTHYLGFMLLLAPFLWMYYKIFIAKKQRNDIIDILITLVIISSLILGSFLINS